MDNETDVLAVLAIPVIVQEEDIVSPAPNHRDSMHSGNICFIIHCGHLNNV